MVICKSRFWLPSPGRFITDGSDFIYSDKRGSDGAALAVSVSGHAGAACDFVAVVANAFDNPEISGVATLASFTVNMIGCAGGSESRVIFLIFEPRPDATKFSFDRGLLERQGVQFVIFFNFTVARIKCNGNSSTMIVIVLLLPSVHVMYITSEKKRPFSIRLT